MPFWSRDKRPPENFRITFRSDLLTESLWEYGEDELAVAALRLTEDELYRVQQLAAWHHVNDPDPPSGPKLTNARIMSRAMIEFAEGRKRDTARVRRRTRPEEQRYYAGDRPASTAVEHGLHDA